VIAAPPRDHYPFETDGKTSQLTNENTLRDSCFDVRNQTSDVGL
jgi:hypothetical protein